MKKIEKQQWKKLREKNNEKIENKKKKKKLGKQ